MSITIPFLASFLVCAPADDGCRSTTTAAAETGQRDIVETAVAAGRFDTLAAALGAGGLVEALKGEGPFTVFAPTDEAFAKLPKETLASLLEPENAGLLEAILTYHVVSGKLTAKQVVSQKGAVTLNGQRLDFATDDDGVMVDGARVVSADLACSNGVIHVVDTVLMPSTADIVQTAMGAGSFDTLTAALKAAQLVEALKGKGPFTVFAPTDDAFAALPDGTVASLLEASAKDKLTAILKYHVVPGRVYADTVAAGGDLETLQGSALHTGQRDGGVFVGRARVVKADIEASNGVIHVIDSVLLPE